MRMPIPPENQKNEPSSPIGRYGLAAHGVTVALVATYWISAAIPGQHSKADELRVTLQGVQQNPKGWLPLLTLGTALAASALFRFH